MTINSSFLLADKDLSGIVAGTVPAYLYCLLLRRPLAVDVCSAVLQFYSGVSSRVCVFARAVVSPVIALANVFDIDFCLAPLGAAVRDFHALEVSL